MKIKAKGLENIEETAIKLLSKQTTKVRIYLYKRKRKKECIKNNYA